MRSILRASSSIMIHNIGLIQKHGYSVPSGRLDATGAKRWAPTQSVYNTRPWTERVRYFAVARDSDTKVTKEKDLSPGPKEFGLLLHNSMSRKKELFRPLEDNKVSMYVCGVTVYDYSHIGKSLTECLANRLGARYRRAAVFTVLSVIACLAGHARAYVSFDILYRYLQHLGYEVTYCRNFTDIDDKIIDRAAKNGEDPLELSRRFAEEFHVDMEMLGCQRPTLEPLATEHINDMILSITRIIENGHAYVTDGDVFFDVMSLPDYGRLSGRQVEDNRAGERVSIDSRKKSPADFALWKSAKPGEPTWDSPWGSGRPGWHIECSSMIRAIFGETIDIHGGGSDLLFPHHENELAQARATAKPCCGEHSSDASYFARWWVHNGFVNVDSEKMSKSLGNFFTIREVLDSYHPMALRWFLISTQYRQAINYTVRGLEEASDRIFYLYQTLCDARDVLSDQSVGESNLSSGTAEQIMREVYNALSDDLNTPLVLASFSPHLKTLNDLIHTKKGKKTVDRISVIGSTTLALEESLRLLGLLPKDDISVLLQELKTSALKRAQVSEDDVYKAIEDRAAARAAKEYGTADEIRKAFEEKGIFIMDTPTGTSWRPGARPEN